MTTYSGPRVKYFFSSVVSNVSTGLLVDMDLF